MSDEEYDDGLILGSIIDLEDIIPIDFCCKKCGHSSDDHEDDKATCEHGLVRKCECRHFELDFDDIDQVKSELMKIEDKLLEYYKDAKRLHDT